MLYKLIGETTDGRVIPGLVNPETGKQFVSRTFFAVASLLKNGGIVHSLLGEIEGGKARGSAIFRPVGQVGAKRRRVLDVAALFADGSDDSGRDAAWRGPGNNQRPESPPSSSDSDNPAQALQPEDPPTDND